MLRIDFIQWDLLWTDNPAVAFTSNNILDYSNNGEGVCDLYFNTSDASYMEFVIDWSDISAYWDSMPLQSRYSHVWKYGCKVYQDNVLVYTGVIFIDSVRIDKVNYRFAFTVLSTTGFLTRASDNFTYTIPGTSRTIDELVGNPDPVNQYSLIQQAMETPFTGISVANRPSFQYDGRAIQSPFFIDMVLPNYENDFSRWQWIYDPGYYGNYVQNSYKAVNLFPVVEYDTSTIPPTFTITNKLCIFMFKEQYNAASPFMYECIIKIYIINGLGDYERYRDVHRTHRSSSAFNLDNYNLNSMLLNAPDWINIANNSTAEYQNTAEQFSIRQHGYNNEYWQYSGIAEINSVQIDTENADVNPMQTLSDLLFLRQSAMTNDPAGNIVCKVRPILNDPQGSVSITNAAIGNPTYSGVFVKSVADNIGFDFMLNITDVINYIKQYFQTILSWYRVKLSITVDGSVSLGLGSKITYENRQYVVTRLRSDYIAYTTEIEAYGQV